MLLFIRDTVNRTQESFTRNTREIEEQYSNVIFDCFIFNNLPAHHFHFAHARTFDPPTKLPTPVPQTPICVNVSSVYLQHTTPQWPPNTNTTKGPTRGPTSCWPSLCFSWCQLRRGGFFELFHPARPPKLWKALFPTTMSRCN